MAIFYLPFFINYNILILRVLQSSNNSNHCDDLYQKCAFNVHLLITPCIIPQSVQQSCLREYLDPFQMT